MQTVVVFGGRSFIGDHICRALVARGYNVRSVGCSIKDHERLRKSLAGCDGLVYAAIPYFTQSLCNSSTAYRAIAEFKSFLKFLSSVRIKKAVFVSICGTIGSAKGLANENTPSTEARGLHQKQKMMAERLILDYAHSGSHAVIVNPTMCVGPLDQKPSTGQFFRFLDRLPFAVMAGQKINIVDVEDVAVGTVLALERGRPGQRYILAYTNTTLGELQRRIKKLRGKPMPSISIPRWIAYALAYVSEAANLVLRRYRPLVPLVGLEMIEYGMQHYDGSKAQRELGFRPRDAWPAVERAVRWYEANDIL